MNTTKIEWAQATWNPVTGCTKISPGCKNCYAATMHDRRHKAYMAGKKMPVQYAKPFSEIQIWPDRLDQPVRTRAPSRTFVCSGADLFHDDVPDEFLNRLFSETMEVAQQHTYILLTKRAERMQKYLSWRWGDGRIPARNIWLGVTAEDQRRADARIPLLLKTPAAVRFVSLEPLLGGIRLYPERPTCAETRLALGSDNYRNIPMTETPVAALTYGKKINWVIVGGESGPHARPMDPEWARAARDQCRAAGVPFLFKQWGEWLPIHRDPGNYCCDHHCGLPKRMWEYPGAKIEVNRSGHIRVGKKLAGRLLDGVLHDEYPAGKDGAK